MVPAHKLDSIREGDRVNTGAGGGLGHGVHGHLLISGETITHKPVATSSNRHISGKANDRN